LQESISQIQSWAELLGPNKYVQAVGIALAFIVMGKIVDLGLGKLFLQVVARSKTSLDDDFIRLLHKPVFVTFVLIGLAMATRSLELGTSPQFITLAILRTIAIVIWYSFLRQVITLVLGAIKRSPTRDRSQANMLPLLDNALKVILLALAAYFFFLAWQINVTAWVASAGIVGLALSFAARDTLSNLFAGVSIAADTPYKVGDFIILDTGERGQVTQIGLRSTRILTRDDIEITIPNGIIGNSKIINEAGGPSAKHRIRIDVGVAYGSDVDQVIEVLNGIAGEHTEVCKHPEPRVRLRRFGDSSLDFQLLCWIDRPVDRGRLTHELLCHIYKAFAVEGIEIPFPQRDLHVRSMVPVPD
jgi:small-conductance mechanosensitive channel